MHFYSLKKTNLLTNNLNFAINCDLKSIRFDFLQATL